MNVFHGLNSCAVSPCVPQTEVNISHIGEVKHTPLIWDEFSRRNWNNSHYRLNCPPGMCRSSFSYLTLLNQTTTVLLSIHKKLFNIDNANCMDELKGRHSYNQGSQPPNTGSTAGSKSWQLCECLTWLAYNNSAPSVGDDQIYIILTVVSISL